MGDAVLSQAGDYGEERSEPWTYRERIVPLRTYCGRIVHRRHKHYFTVKDATRILDKLVPPESADGSMWAQQVIELLRGATLRMLDTLLPFLESWQIQGIYDWSVGLIDKLLGITNDIPRNQQQAIDLIYYLASRTGLTVDIKRSY